MGQRLRAQRQGLALTQEELAARIGASARTVIAYENGTSTIRFEKLMALASAGIDINYLVYGPSDTLSVPVNEALWQRVKEWAQRVCVDSRGKPIHELERFQVMQRVYRQLAGTDAAEVDAVLETLAVFAAKPAKRA